MSEKPDVANFREESEIASCGCPLEFYNSQCACDPGGCFVCDETRAAAWLDMENDRLRETAASTKGAA